MENAQQLIGERIRAVGSIRRFPARSFLFHEGDDSSSVMVIESGLLRVDHNSLSGRVVLLDLLSSGRILGELGGVDNMPRSATVSTVTDAEVRSVPSADFRRMLAEDNELQGAVLSVIATRLRAMSTQFVETSIMDAPARIAARLVRLVEIEEELGRSEVDFDGSIDLRLPISQEELGQWSGLSREGAGKGLATLRSIGLIETGRKRVAITDVDRLRSVAESG